MTITRTGGIAGFQNVIVMTRDGRVTVTGRGLRQGCRLTPAAVKRLTTAASSVPWARITPDSGRARFPDDMVMMAKSPAGGPFRLENPRVGAARKVFLELFNDIAGGLARSRMCKAA